MRYSQHFTAALYTFLFVAASVISPHVNATNYYLSNEGNDEHAGTSPSLAWKTLGKLNSFKNLRAGDSVLLKRGDVFYGSVDIVRTYGDRAYFGTVYSPITFSSYGVGAKPVITGFTTVSGWVNKGGNIWESTDAVSGLSTVTVVTVNGVNTAMGRYPNDGWKTIQSATHTSIHDNTLKQMNWVGAELVMKKEKYIIDRDPIISQTGSTLNFSTASGYSPRVGWGYFIQNHLKTLDAPNEWYYDSATKKLFLYSASKPGLVKASSSKMLINLIGYSKGYLTFDGLRFEGANESAISIGAFGHINIKNCDFALCYAGIQGWNYDQHSDRILVDHCTFSDIQDIAILFPDEFINAVLSNNSIKNVGLLAGMSGSGDYKACGMRVQGAFSLVQYNRIENTGYHGIIFNGEGVVIKNNFIDNALAVKDDGGGIYTYEDYYPGKVIESNIVLNCHGDDGGVPKAYLPKMTNAEGIYLDGWSSNLTVINNTVSNIRKSGIMVNLGDNITIRGNTIFNCFRQGMDIRDVINNTPHKSTGLNVKDNIIVQKDRPLVDYFGSRDFNQLMLNLVSADNNFAKWGVIDSNYYGRPIDNSPMFNIQPDNSTWTKGKYLALDLAGWRNYKGDDVNSHTAPVQVKDTSDIMLKYNATKLPVVEKIKGTWVDMKGKLYTGEVSLQPYSSVILMKWPFKLPIADAGPDKIITLPENSVKLGGTATQTDRKVTRYLWKKIAGPSGCTIADATLAVTHVRSLTQGIYRFELTVTDDKGGVGKDTMQVSVLPATNVLPVADAGKNITVTLPDNIITLRGGGTAADGRIVSWLWKKVSGPAAHNIVNTRSPLTDVSGLVEGIYRFELSVTDDKGGVGKDTMQVSVLRAATVRPVADAGPDLTVTVPGNQVVLKGSGTHADGQIVSYLWQQLSGPNMATIYPHNQAVTSVANLTGGTYFYQLTVTDSRGETARDTMVLTVVLARLSSGEKVVNFYPNPVADAGILEVNSKTASSELVVVITDLQGKMISRKKLNFEKQTVRATIQTDDLPKGVYMLTVYFNEINWEILKFFKS